MVKNFSLAVFYKVLQTKAQVSYQKKTSVEVKVTFQNIGLVKVFKYLILSTLKYQK